MAGRPRPSDDRDTSMAARERLTGLDHVVVVMFENRSFDHLLGRLYEPGEVQSFEGVMGKDLSNPIPDWAEHGADRAVVPYGIAPNMNTPNPDPGEEYQHVNTQLYGLIDPPSNRGVLAEHMVAPFNAPADPNLQPTMQGFVTDYISAFAAEMGHEPTYAQYSQIMTGYTPEQMPVLSTLARGFATFDHWFAEVPSQTFTNRSFFHAATASGFVVNAPYANFPEQNNAETLFERLESKGLTWRVYCDPPSPATFTGIIHGPRLRHRFASNFFTTDQFFEDVAQGQLPTYSFIEPNMWHGHNDMHPPISMLTPGLELDAPSALLGGEELLARIYNAVRSSTANGSNCFNTLLLVAFDEHGGTYDHVPPPAASPPDAAAGAGQLGFGFNRLGVRLPVLAISPWIAENTVVNDIHHHTSVMRTMRQRWDLGNPFTAREADAPDLAPVLTRDMPRHPDDWPDVVPQPVPAFDESLLPPDEPLSPIAQAFIVGGVRLARDLGADVPEITNPADLKGSEGLELLHAATGHLFPGLAHS